ncbi:MAG: glycosyltransferase family 4 protein [Deltaproteobacteria bacterium]|nr:glycosyltransferase family 4 protein [Deltaproteobacteria bacterium]
MKILYVSQYFPPEMGAPAARVSELARHWVKAGHEVTVLTGFPNHPTGIVPTEYRTKLRKLVCREQKDGIDVVRTWLFPCPNRKAHERLLNYLSFVLSSCITGIFLRRPDIIIATSPQLFVGLTGRWLGWIKRVPFILEVRDLWPDSITASGMGSEADVSIRLLRALSSFLYRSCNHLVVVTPAFKQELVAKWHVRAEKISLVENGVETDLFTPDDIRDDVKRELGLEGKFVVSYIGTLGLAHGLHAVVKAAAQLQSAFPDIQFLFVGEGADKDRLVSLVSDLQLNNVRFLPQQPRQKVPSFIRASDVCLVLLKKASVFETVIPTKMLEFMACGRPVILGVDGQARQVIEKAEAGVFIEPEDHAALAQAVRQLHLDLGLRKALGENGRKYIVDHLSRKRTAKTYTGVLENVIRNGKRESETPCKAKVGDGDYGTRSEE